jgi:hypothetical protein
MVLLNHDLSILQDFHVSCFSLAETNLNWHRPHVKMEFLGQQRSVWKGQGGVKTALSSINLDSLFDYQTGGTVTSAIGPWCTQVLFTDSDPSGMGRWSSLTFIGRQHRRITVFTGYRCIQSSGNTSAWTQEKVYLRAKLNQSNPHPCHQFILDLICFLNDKRSQDHDLLVALDANEVLGDESTGLSKLLHDCGLQDLMTIPTANDSAQLQDTSQRGTNCYINYILGMDQVLQSIHRHGALVYDDGIVSDLDLDPHLLFGGNASNPVSLSSHGFTSKNDKKVTEYVNSLERY